MGDVMDGWCSKEVVENGCDEEDVAGLTGESIPNRVWDVPIDANYTACPRGI